MAHPHGLFTWVDVASPNPEAAAAFYQAVFGWEAEQASPDESMPYWMFSRDGRTAAGMGPLSEEQLAQGIPPAWNSYVNVDDVAATATKAEELGGAVIMQPMQIFTSGKMAIIADPAGATFALWQAGDHTGAEEFNTPGFLCWNELATRDLEGATQFYGDLFGWTSETSDMGNGSLYTSFSVGDRVNAGAYDATSVLPNEVPPHWAVYFTVEDCNEAVAAVGEAGGTVVREPFDTPVGPVAVCTDPFGAYFMVIALSDAA